MRFNDASTFNVDKTVRTYEDGVCVKETYYLTDTITLPDADGIDWNVSGYVINPTGRGQECECRVTNEEYTGRVFLIEHNVDQNGKPEFIDVAMPNTGGGPTFVPFIRIDQRSLPEESRGYGIEMVKDRAFGGLRPNGEVVMSGILTSDNERYQITEWQPQNDWYIPDDIDDPESIRVDNDLEPDSDDFPVEDWDEPYFDMGDAAPNSFPANEMNLGLDEQHSDEEHWGQQDSDAPRTWDEKAVENTSVSEQPAANTISDNEGEIWNETAADNTPAVNSSYISAEPDTTAQPISSYDAIHHGQPQDIEEIVRGITGRRGLLNSQDHSDKQAMPDATQEEKEINSFKAIADSFGFDNKETFLGEFAGLINETIRNGVRVPSVNPEEKICYLFDNKMDPVCKVTYMTFRDALPKGGDLYWFKVEDGSGKIVFEPNRPKGDGIVSIRDIDSTYRISTDNEPFQNTIYLKGIHTDGLIQLTSIAGSYNDTNEMIAATPPRGIDVNEMQGWHSDKISVREETGNVIFEIKEVTSLSATKEPMDIRYEAKIDGDNLIPLRAEFTPSDKSSTTGAVSKEFEDGVCVRENHYLTNQVTTPDERGIDTNLEYSLINPKDMGEACETKLHFQDGYVRMVEHDVDFAGFPDIIDVMPQKPDFSGEQPFIRIESSIGWIDGSRMTGVEGIGRVPVGNQVMSGVMVSNSEAYEIRSCQILQEGIDRKYIPPDARTDVIENVEKIPGFKWTLSELEKEREEHPLRGVAGLDVKKDEILENSTNDLETEQHDDRNGVDSPQLYDRIEQKQDNAELSGKLESGKLSTQEKAEDVESGKPHDGQMVTADANKGSLDTSEVSISENNADKHATEDVESIREADNEEFAELQEKDVAIAAGSQEKNNDQIETVTEARLSYESVFLDKLETAKSTDLHIFDTSGKGGTVTYQVDDGKTETKTGASEDLLDGRIRLTEDMLPVLLPEGVGYTGRGGVFVDIMHPDGNMDSYYANGDGKIMFSIDRDGHASIGGGGYDTVADAFAAVYGKTSPEINQAVHDFAAVTDSVKMLSYDEIGLGSILSANMQEPAANGVSAGTPLEAIARDIMYSQPTGADAKPDIRAIDTDLINIKDRLSALAPENKELIESGISKVMDFVNSNSFLDPDISREDRRCLIWDLDKPTEKGDYVPLTKEEVSAIGSAYKDMALYTRCLTEGNVEYPTERADKAIGYERTAKTIDNFTGTLKTFLAVELKGMLSKEGVDIDKVVKGVSRGTSRGLPGEVNALIDTVNKIEHAAADVTTKIHDAVGKDFCKSAFVPGVCEPVESTYKQETFGHSLLDAFVPANAGSEMERIDQASDAVSEFIAKVYDAFNDFDNNYAKEDTIDVRFESFLQSLGGMGYSVEDGAIVTPFGTDKDANIHIFKDDAPNGIKILRDTGDNSKTNPYIIAPEDDKIPGMEKGVHFGFAEFDRAAKLVENAVYPIGAEPYVKITEFTSDMKDPSEAVAEGADYSDKDILKTLNLIYAEASGYNDFVSIDSKIENMIDRGTEGKEDPMADQGVDTQQKGQISGAAAMPVSAPSGMTGNIGNSQISPMDNRTADMHEREKVGRSIIWELNLENVRVNPRVEKLQEHVEQRNKMIERCPFQPYYRGNAFFQYHEWKAISLARDEGVAINGYVPNGYDVARAWMSFKRSNVFEALVYKEMEKREDSRAANDTTMSREYVNDVLGIMKDELNMSNGALKRLMRGITKPSHMEKAGLPGVKVDISQYASKEKDDAKEETHKKDGEGKSNHGFLKAVVVTAAIAAVCGITGIVAQGAEIDSGVEKRSELQDRAADRQQEDKLSKEEKEDFIEKNDIEVMDETNMDDSSDEMPDYIDQNKEEQNEQDQADADEEKDAPDIAEKDQSDYVDQDSDKRDGDLEVDASDQEKDGISLERDEFTYEGDTPDQESSDNGIDSTVNDKEDGYVDNDEKTDSLDQGDDRSDNESDADSKEVDNPDNGSEDISTQDDPKEREYYDGDISEQDVDDSKEGDIDQEDEAEQEKDAPGTDEEDRLDSKVDQNTSHDTKADKNEDGTDQISDDTEEDKADDDIDPDEKEDGVIEEDDKDLDNNRDNSDQDKEGPDDTNGKEREVLKDDDTIKEEALKESDMEEKPDTSASAKENTVDSNSDPDSESDNKENAQELLSNKLEKNDDVSDIIGVATMQELNKDDEDDLDTREQEDTDYKERTETEEDIQVKDIADAAESPAEDMTTPDNTIIEAVEQGSTHHDHGHADQDDASNAVSSIKEAATGDKEEKSDTQNHIDAITDAFSDFLDTMTADPSISFDDFLNQDFQMSGQTIGNSIAEEIGTLLSEGMSPVSQMEDILADYIRNIDPATQEGIDALSQAVDIGLDLTSIAANDADNFIDPVQSLENITLGADAQTADHVFAAAADFMEMETVDSWDSVANDSSMDSADTSWISQLETSDFMDADFMDQVLNDMENGILDDGFDLMSQTESGGVDALNDAIEAREMQADNTPALNIDLEDFLDNSHDSGSNKNDIAADTPSDFSMEGNTQADYDDDSLEKMESTGAIV